MAEIESEVKVLSDSLIWEIVNATGLPKKAFFKEVFKGLFHRATERLAHIGITADRLLVQAGLSQAAHWMYSNFCKEVTIHGKEVIPAEGPLLIVSNHSGTYDSLVLASHIGREDLKVIASNIQFFKKLPHIAEHLIFLSDQVSDRVAATRAGIRQLKEGGAFLIFGTGRIDPDPEVYPQAERFIDRWSPSIDLFLRSVPQARVVVAIVSGVLSKRWSHHLITRLRRQDWEQRRLAEFGQVLQQLFQPGSLYLSPRVSFAPPVSVATLREECPGESLLPAVIQRGKALMQDHCRQFSQSADRPALAM
jgi:hypothetical protein